MKCWLLLGLAAARSVHANVEGPPLNCSLDLCLNAENLCGQFQTPCQRIGSVQAGVDVWVSMKFELMKHGDVNFYRRTERGAFTQQDCEADNSWLEVDYEGSYTEHGPSLTMNGSHWAETYISSTWIQLLKDEVCVKQETMSGTTKCQGWLLDTKKAIKELCPCNDWPWSAGQRRNVGMFCSPLEQCPVLHKSLVHQSQYFSYNASTSAACFSKVAPEKVRGWYEPQDEGCYVKTAPATCPGGILIASTSQHGTSVAKWLVLGLSALSALLARSHPGTTV